MTTRLEFSCMVVDDDLGFASMLTKIVTEEGGRVTHCADLKTAGATIQRCIFDLVILDNRLPDGTGYGFFSELNRSCPESIVLMVTGLPELAQAIELTRNGLFDYLTKPLNVNDFTACLTRVRRRLCHPDQPYAANELAGTSPAIREVYNSIQQAARHAEATVLLTGETGTGKDLAARLLHRLTYPRQNDEAAYVPVNCSAIPAEMFESELFGSEKGAFTGADKRKQGLIETAADGTLFLDEITETPLPQQAKLLRFLESREYRPLGSTVLRKFAGRVVAATNRSLLEEVKRGRLREDLMFRLSVVAIHLPTLRDHMDDLEAIVENLLTQLCAKYKRKKPHVRPGDLEKMQGYPFFGNVRELRNLLERALLRTEDDASWLAFDHRWLGSSAASPPSPPPPVLAVPALPERALGAMELQEYRLIQQALQAESGGIRRAALRLGITHQSLLRRLEKWPELRQVASRAT